MDPATYVDPELTIADHLVLETLVDKPASNGECPQAPWQVTAH